MDLNQILPKYLLKFSSYMRKFLFRWQCFFLVKFVNKFYTRFLIEINTNTLNLNNFQTVQRYSEEIPQSTKYSYFIFVDIYCIFVSTYDTYILKNTTERISLQLSEEKCS